MKFSSCWMADENVIGLRSTSVIVGGGAAAAAAVAEEGAGEDIVLA